jgi:hypothetical protein
MKLKNQVVFDIREERFKYLHRADVNSSKRVDMVDLNRRLNQTKKTNFYTNTKIIATSFLIIGIIFLISLKF